MDLVVNEWLPEYFRPDASPEEKRALEEFLICFLERGDKIIVKKPSPFLNKIYRYAKDFQHRNSVVNPIRNFIKHVLLDSDRCKLVEDETTLVIPDPILEKLSIGNYDSDTYLFEAASFINDNEKTIVTTDARLKNHFQGNSWCNIILLSEFLENYCTDD